MDKSKGDEMRDKIEGTSTLNDLNKLEDDVGEDDEKFFEKYR